MGALSPRSRVIAPDEIIRPNAAMNSAYAKIVAGLWNAPKVFAPYVAAGYGDATNALIAFPEQIPAGSDHLREFVKEWAKTRSIRDCRYTRGKPETKRNRRLRQKKKRMGRDSNPR